MDRTEFSNFTHISFIEHLLTKKESMEAFKRDTGYGINNLLERTEFEKMIDKATGYEQKIIYSFIVWATENFWDEPEENEKIEIYVRAKEYIKNNP